MGFVFLYKKDTVVTGNDGVGFIKATRKQEVVVTLYIASCICALFAYFICVINQYVDALKEPEEEMMMMMEEEKKEWSPWRTLLWNERIGSQNLAILYGILQTRMG